MLPQTVIPSVRKDAGTCILHVFRYAAWESTVPDSPSVPPLLTLDRVLSGSSFFPAISI